MTESGEGDARDPAATRIAGLLRAHAPLSQLALAQHRRRTTKQPLGLKTDCGSHAHGLRTQRARLRKVLPRGKVAGNPQHGVCCARAAHHQAGAHSKRHWREVDAGAIAFACRAQIHCLPRIRGHRTPPLLGCQSPPRPQGAYGRQKRCCASGRGRLACGCSPACSHCAGQTPGCWRFDAPQCTAAGTQHSYRTHARRLSGGPGPARHSLRDLARGDASCWRWRCCRRWRSPRR